MTVVRIPRRAFVRPSSCSLHVEELSYGQDIDGKVIPGPTLHRSNLQMHRITIQAVDKGEGECDSADL